MKSKYNWNAQYIAALSSPTSLDKGSSIDKSYIIYHMNITIPITETNKES
jgi:hypothetical protein